PQSPGGFVDRPSPVGVRALPRFRLVEAAVGLPNLFQGEIEGLLQPDGLQRVGDLPVRVAYPGAGPRHEIRGPSLGRRGDPPGEALSGQDERTLDQVTVLVREYLVSQ